MRPQKLHWLFSKRDDLQPLARLRPFNFRTRWGVHDLADVLVMRVTWDALLGGVEPPANPKVTAGKADPVPGGTLARFAMDAEPGIVVPFVLLTPDGIKKPPVVVMVGQGGKAALLKQRGEIIAALMKAGMAVCLVDVRGTGETQPGDGSPGRVGTRTSISQTNQMLGRPVLGGQLRDLRAVIRWLNASDAVSGKRVFVWGDSLVEPNGPKAPFEAPLDAPQLPRYAEPGGALLAVFARVYEGSVVENYSVGGCAVDRRSRSTFWKSPYLYVPHDAVIPLTALPLDFPDPYRYATVATVEVSTWNRRIWFPIFEPHEIDTETLIDTKPADVAKALARVFARPERSRRPLRR